MQATSSNLTGTFGITYSKWLDTAWGAGILWLCLWSRKCWWFYWEIFHSKTVFNAKIFNHNWNSGEFYCSSCHLGAINYASGVVNGRFYLQLLVRDYNLDSKHKPSFCDEDILNLYPVIKHSSPRASDGYQFYQSAQAKVQQGMSWFFFSKKIFPLFNND